MKNMILKTKKAILCFILVSILLEISADFVLGSLSDKLTVQIQDTKRLIAQEQKKAKEEKALEQAPTSVTVTEASDGSKNITINANVNIGFGDSLSGEIIRAYSVRLVDLVALKNVYDLWKSYIDKALETEVVFILVLSAIFRRQHILNDSWFPCLFSFRSAHYIKQ
jgi:hypothetical protein